MLLNVYTMYSTDNACTCIILTMLTENTMYSVYVPPFMKAYCTIKRTNKCALFVMLQCIQCTNTVEPLLTATPEKRPTAI